MREIKYRAFDIVTGEMKEIESIVFYKKIDENGMMGEVFYHGASSSRYFGENTNGFDMEQCKLMQYTGLKDKNGKDVYEGDIVEVSGYGYDFQEVKWDEEWRGFNLIFDARPIEVFPYQSSEIEIIGNIYENPSLLENE